MQVKIWVTTRRSISLPAVSRFWVIESISSMNKRHGANILASLNNPRIFCSDSPLIPETISGAAILKNGTFNSLKKTAYINNKLTQFKYSSLLFSVKKLLEGPCFVWKSPVSHHAFLRLVLGTTQPIVLHKEYCFLGLQSESIKNLKSIQLSCGFDLFGFYWIKLEPNQVFSFFSFSRYGIHIMF